jgi:ABC-type molybdate transport system permease subunit
MPIRYIVIGALSVIMVIVLSKTAGKYNQRVEEILSMDMVFTPVVFCMMVILEAVYQTLYWFCRRKQ